MQMNTLRISMAVRDIEKNTTALKWLETYGVQITGRDREQISINIRPAFAGSCDGAAEAAEVLSAFALLSMPELVSQSIRNCRNTIEIAKAAIIEEAGRASLQHGGE